MVGLSGPTFGEFRPDGGVVTRTSTAYSYGLGETNCWVRHANAAAITATVLPHAQVPYPIGTEITAEQAGAGQVTIVAGSGVTINSPATLKTNAQWSVVVLKQVDTDVWTLAGDIAPS
jgi:hypothetical protein